MVHCYMYEAKLWTMLKGDKITIETFETWCWKIILKILRTERVSNEEIYDRIKDKNL